MMETLDPSLNVAKFAKLHKDLGDFKKDEANAEKQKKLDAFKVFCAQNKKSVPVSPLPSKSQPQVKVETQADLKIKKKKNPAWNLRISVIKL